MYSRSFASIDGRSNSCPGKFVIIGYDCALDHFQRVCNSVIHHRFILSQMVLNAVSTLRRMLSKHLTYPIQGGSGCSPESRISQKQDTPPRCLKSFDKSGERCFCRSCLPYSIRRYKPLSFSGSHRMPIGIPERPAYEDAWNNRYSRIRRR